MEKGNYKEILEIFAESQNKKGYDTKRKDDWNSEWDLMIKLYEDNQQ